MHPARAKAKQVAALVETAQSVADLTVQMDRIEAKLDLLLEQLPVAPAPAPAQPPPPEPARKK